MSASQSLPPELVDCILSYIAAPPIVSTLSDDSPAHVYHQPLLAISLLCRSWSRPAQLLLFQSAIITATNIDRMLERMDEMECSNAVRSVRLGRSMGRGLSALETAWETGWDAAWTWWSGSVSEKDQKQTQLLQTVVSRLPRLIEVEILGEDVVASLVGVRPQESLLDSSASGMR